MQIAFKGKEAVYNYHLTVPYRPIVPDQARSVGEGQLEDNLIIYGDNLHALKALMPRYAGAIDCIFIDPPYNTGNESWSYNDAVNSPPARDWLRKVVDRDDLLRHDKWCCMMWPRLRLLWELLAETASFWMTIDDNEIHHARMMLDEIFGEGNFVATVIWHKMDSPKNTAEFFSEDHDYLLVYAKNKSVWNLSGFERTDEQLARYTNPDDDPRGPWLLGDLAARNVYAAGVYSITTPTGKVIPGPPPGSYWRVKETKFWDMVADNRIFWGSGGDGRPGIKRFLSEVREGVVPQTIWHWRDSGSTRHAKHELHEIFPHRGESDFVTPKPTALLERILTLAIPDGGTVLDSFAGSATTANAVLSLNSRDQLSRKFILVESEEYADTLSAERVRRVINGYPFQGNQRETLLERNLTWKDIKQASKLIEQVEDLQAKRRKDFDKIRVDLKDGRVRVVGERSIEMRAPGVGGSFSFCTLGKPLDLDQMLVGEELPSWSEVAAWLFHTATGATLPPEGLSPGVGIEEWFVAESPTHNVWTIYRPLAEFLRSPDAALTLSVAEQIASRRNGKMHLVFAPFRFASNAQLRALGVEYAMLPFALNRLERE